MRTSLVSILAAALLLPFDAFAQAPPPADSGLISRQSAHSVSETLDRFEAAAKAKGLVVFTRIDHAAAAAQAGQQLRPRTVVVFGNPAAGTAPMRAAPTLAIDLPMRALVWEDDAGKVWLTHNSGAYLARSVFPRHGLTMPAGAAGANDALLDELSRQAAE